jgi:hypothetical protein
MLIAEDGDLDGKDDLIGWLIGLFKYAIWADSFLFPTSCTRHALQCQSKTPLPLDIA